MSDLHRIALSLCAVLGAATATLPAQIPDGAAVVSCFFEPASGPGGLWVIDPSGGATPVGGLPPALAQANWVLRDPQTGHLLTGNRQLAPGGSVLVYELAITGAAPSFTANVIQAFALGTRGNGTVNGAVHQAAWMPTGRRLALATNGIAAGPAAAQTVWILDLTTGALTAPPLGAWTSVGFNAVAVAPDGASLFVAEFGAPFDVLQVPLAGPGPTLIQSTSPYVATALAIDCAGDLLAFTSLPPGQVFRFTPPTPPLGTWTSNAFGPGLPPLNAGVLDPVTCDVLVATVVPGSTTVPPAIVRMTNASAVTTVASGFWGFPSGLDFDPNPEAMFEPTPSPSGVAPRWAYRPFPTTAPLRGTTFAAQIDAGPGAVLTAAFLSLGRLDWTGPFGLALHLDPAAMWTLGTLAGPSPTFAQAIPNAPWVVGVTLSGQAVALDTGGGLASSDLLVATIR